ncbi:sensor histidine kinase [Pseudemcibacter aquimaris]|uniref:sensor histidine kinase n=1 Tax=Pseudemcibacter aquimaris TaxID=2857064 RepID=UPI0020117801|nr:histidine kinase [Pseudemcibacter aquimaris]MCC3862003.1 histidine kinase [Pseudemcibacter aquimaris]WDU58755.1 histidine kinase [Pseudemcibacter aquimaris]
MNHKALKYLDPHKGYFYAIQIVLWVLYGLIFRLIWVGYDQYTPPEPAWYIVYNTGGFICSSFLALILWKCKDKEFYSQCIIALFCAMIVAVIWRYTFNYIDIHILLGKQPKEIDFFKYIIGGMSSFIQLLAWSIGYLLILFYIKYEDQQARAAKAELQAKEAIIKQLHQQISPHFLFNVLNSVDTMLMKEDVGEARSMVAKLSEYLRQSLKNKNEYSTTLKEEISSAAKYLEIEKVRFKDKLDIRFSNEQDTNDFLVPRLILQPLLENAIKHSINYNIHGGMIEIGSRLNQNTLVIYVKNTARDHENGQDVKNEKHGIGLDNTKARIAVFYGEKAHVDIVSNAEEFKVTITIPMDSFDQ